MAAREYTNNQKKIINRYYDNKDTIMLTKLQEIVTELYLADSAKKKTQLWARVEKALLQLKIKPAIMQHILEKQNPEILAKNINDWMTR